MNREKLTLFLISEGIYVAVVGVMLWFMFPSFQLSVKHWAGHQRYYWQLGRTLARLQGWQLEALQVRGKMPGPKTTPPKPGQSDVPPAFRPVSG